MKILTLFAKFLARTVGLHFSSERLPELQQKMTSLARQSAYPDLGKYLLHLMSSPLAGEQLDTLARTLTIGETYFLRDPKSYQVLEEELLPALIASRRSSDKTIKIWSAGCSSGEEPYSIAILLCRAIADLSEWNISILASDINPQALERARQGVYSRWSFRNAPDWLMSYFSKLPDGRFEIQPRIRKMVRFSQLNLAGEEDYPADSGSSEVDIIFCRNVMLYFDQVLIEKTMARFHAALKETGWLFVGPTEVDPQMYREFCCRHYDGAFVLCKGAPQQHAPHTSLPVLLPQQLTGSRTENEAGSLVLKSAASAALPSAVPAASLAQASPPAFCEAKTPDEPAGHAEALALYQAGRYQQAAAHALSSLQPGQEQAGLLGLAARAFANIGRLDEARDCCQKALEADRLSCHLHYLLSIILEQQGDRAGAARSLKNALFIDHDYLLAYFALGNLHRQLGEQGESERNFSNALQLLEKRDPHEVLPEAEGMTAGWLAEIIRAMTGATGRSFSRSGKGR